LVTEDTDTASSTDFIVPEPHRGQPSWNGQNASLADRHHNLTKESDPEAIGGYAEHLYPGADGGPERSDNHRVFEALKSHFQIFFRIFFSLHRC